MSHLPCERKDVARVSTPVRPKPSSFILCGSISARASSVAPVRMPARRARSVSRTIIVFRSVAGMTWCSEARSFHSRALSTRGCVSFSVARSSCGRSQRAAATAVRRSLSRSAMLCSTWDVSASSSWRRRGTPTASS